MLLLRPCLLSEPETLSRYERRVRNILSSELTLIEKREKKLFYKVFMLRFEANLLFIV